MPANETIEELIASLRFRGDTSLAIDAAEALVKLGEAAVEPLVELVRNHAIVGVTHAFLFDRVGYTLSQIGAPAIEPLLQVQREDPRPRIQQFIAKVFGEIGGPDLVPVLTSMLLENKICHAAVALAVIQGTDSIDLIVKAIEGLKWHEKNSSDQMTYVNAFVFIGQPALEPLRGLRGSKNRLLRSTAKLAARKIEKNRKKGIVPSCSMFPLGDQVAPWWLGQW